VPGPELEADVGPGARRAEPERFVERDAPGVRERDPRPGARVALDAERREEDAVEGARDSPAMALSCDVDCSLHRPLIGGAGTYPVRVGVADDGVAVGRDEPGLRRGKRLDPAAELLDRGRLVLEGDPGLAHEGRVYLEEGGRVVAPDEPDLHRQ